MQAILSVTESLQIKVLALTADKIAEILVNENNVCSITPVTKLPKHEANDDKLIAAISTLTDRLGRLEARSDKAHDRDRNKITTITIGIGATLTTVLGIGHLLRLGVKIINCVTTMISLSRWPDFVT